MAIQENWRVFFFFWEHGVEYKELADTVLAHSGKTLVILDYAERMSKLDFASIHRILIPEVHRNDGRLAFLGSSRPGWIRGQEKNEARDTLFHVIELEPSSAQKKSIARMCIERLAPEACKKFGYDFVRNVCGERPIIALIIAAELERRVSEDKIESEELVGIRPGDLVEWLKKRLGEDNFTSKKNEIDMLSLPTRILIAAARMACVPEKKES